VRSVHVILHRHRHICISLDHHDPIRIFVQHFSPSLDYLVRARLVLRVYLLRVAVVIRIRVTRERLIQEAGVLAQMRHRVYAESVHPLVEPESQDILRQRAQYTRSERRVHCQVD